jgi:hypothetical protein
MALVTHAHGANGASKRRAAEVAQPCRCQTLGAYLLLRVVQHAPYRIAAIPEPEAPDQVDAYEALLRARAARGRRFVTVVCGVVAGLSILALAEVPPATHDTKSGARSETPETRAVAKIANAREAIAAASKRAAEEQLRFTAAIRSAASRADRAEPIEQADDAENAMPASRGPCRVALPEASSLVRGRRAFPLLVASGSEPLRSPSLSGVFADIRRAEEHLDNGQFADGILDANALAAGAQDETSRLKYDIVLITSVVKPPVRTSASSFEPGEIAGRAYLYDFAEHRVTCVGDIHASSSRQIEYQYVPGATAGASLDPRSEPVYGQGPSLVASLDVDLELQAQRAIARGALFALDE